MIFSIDTVGRTISFTSPNSAIGGARPVCGYSYPPSGPEVAYGALFDPRSATKVDPGQRRAIP